MTPVDLIENKADYGTVKILVTFKFPLQQDLQQDPNHGPIYRQVKCGLASI